jgi:hypothetical protein
MVWTEHAFDLEDAKKKFFEAREAYIKAKEAPINKPNYVLDLQETEEKMKLQYEELQKWKNKKPQTFDVLGQLRQNALSHPDPKIRANCQMAMASVAQEILKSKPQSFQDAVRIRTDLGMLQLMNLGKSWEEIEANATEQKDRILLFIRNFIIRCSEEFKKEDPNFELTPPLEIAIIERYLELAKRDPELLHLTIKC